MWQPATRTEWYRLLTLSVALAIIGTSALAIGVTTADAQTSIDGFDVTGVDRTVDGDVSDVTVAADVDYTHDVADADRRVVKLQVGPSASALTTVDYVNVRDVAGQDSGTVSLSGSALDHEDLTASDVNPALAESQTTEIVVGATVEVTRSNDETVTDTVTDTVTISLTDDAELTASVGGSGSVSVTTE